MSEYEDFNYDDDEEEEDFQQKIYIDDDDDEAEDDDEDNEDFKSSENESDDTDDGSSSSSSFGKPQSPEEPIKKKPKIEATKPAPKKQVNEGITHTPPSVITKDDNVIHGIPTIQQNIKKARLEAVSLKLSCPVCGKRTLDKKSLDRHLLIHDDMFTLLQLANEKTDPVEILEEAKEEWQSVKKLYLERNASPPKLTPQSDTRKVYLNNGFYGLPLAKQIVRKVTYQKSVDADVPMKGEEEAKIYQLPTELSVALENDRVRTEATILEAAEKVKTHRQKNFHCFLCTDKSYHTLINWMTHLVFRHRMYIRNIFVSSHPESQFKLITPENKCIMCNTNRDFQSPTDFYFHVLTLHTLDLLKPYGNYLYLKIVLKTSGKYLLNLAFEGRMDKLYHQLANPQWNLIIGKEKKLKRLVHRPSVLRRRSYRSKRAAFLNSQANTSLITQRQKGIASTKPTRSIVVKNQKTPGSAHGTQRVIIKPKIPEPSPKPDYPDSSRNPSVASYSPIRFRTAPPNILRGPRPVTLSKNVIPSSSSNVRMIAVPKPYALQPLSPPPPATAEEVPESQPAPEDDDFIDVCG